VSTVALGGDFGHVSATRRSVVRGRGARALHGARAVPPDLFSKALALLVDGITARAANALSGDAA